MEEIISELEDIEYVLRTIHNNNYRSDILSKIIKQLKENIMSVNKVVLIGNVGAEPEIKHFGNGGQVANITLATSESYKNKDGEKITNTEWHRIAVTGKLSEIVEKYVKKGHLLYIEGQLKTRSWEDKDGNKKYVTEVSVRDFGGSIKMLSKKSDDISDVESQNTSPNVSTNIEPESNDDLPF